METIVKAKRAKARSRLGQYGDVLTVPEAAAFVGCSERTLYESIRSGRFPALRLSDNRICIPKRMIERWLAGEWVSPLLPASAERTRRIG